MSWFGDAIDWVADKASDTADAVEDFVDDVADAAANAVESVGDAIEDACDWLADHTGFIGGVFSWVGNIIKNVFSLVGAAIKAVAGIIGAVIGGIIKIVIGILTLHWDLIVSGFEDIVSAVTGSVIVILGKVVSLVQTIFCLQSCERRLTDEEEKKLKKIFKDSLNYYVIRIIDGRAGLFGLNNRPFALGNTIYTKKKNFDFSLLVHETTHVWQYQQTGNKYAGRALGAQWFLDDAYDWQKRMVDNDLEDWTEFNNEAQAEFFEDLWEVGCLKDNTGAIVVCGNGVFFDADNKKTFAYFEYRKNDYTQLAEDALKTVRNEWF